MLISPNPGTRIVTKPEGEEIFSILSRIFPPAIVEVAKWQSETPQGGKKNKSSGLAKISGK